ncbi:hypothetical protein [Bradyrhizobium elkanii]|uniref:hypothetical protein n=1 Tax=Bradyrhizobium elkanii TaxID=29448 RepID=UPI001AE8BD44|nr:hypothetical protein [Bradyrhizobium elkanii]MBP2434094.1 hypothetical protein [Bradyrhizobium elkanii]WLA88979.1 hypothetical protein QNJ96_28280 [Bradyrhizobium elkanii]
MAGYLGKIELTQDERALLEQIDFDLSSHEDQNLLTNAKPVGALMDSLIKRDGLPYHRISWFIDPAYHRKGAKHSRQGMFERNGIVGRNIFYHPSFLEHLHYFIYGANLPTAVIDRFSFFVSQNQPVSRRNVRDVANFADDLASKFRIDFYEAADEFFKLALDCGVHLDWAQYIHDHVSKNERTR